MSEQKSLKKNAVLNTVKTFLALCFPLITFPYSSRILGPENLGKVNFAQSIVSYFAIFASLGISTYATREAAKVRENQNQLNKVCKEIFTINMIATVISYIALAISLCFIKKLYYYRELIIICSSLILFTSIGMGWLYQALEDYLYITIRSIGFQILSIMMLFTLVKSKDDYLWYAAINIISNVGANIFNFIHSRKFISFSISEKLELKKHLKPIFILFASAIAGTICSSIDTTMLGFMSNDTEVGLYSAGLKIVKMVQHLFPAIIIVIFPRISYYIANNDQESINKLIKKTIDSLICFALPITLGIMLLIKPLVMIFCGEAYIRAIPVSQIMSPYIILTALSGFFSVNLLIAFGKEKVTLIGIIISSIIDIVLNTLLIPLYGAYGAGTATLIAEFSLLLFTIIYLRQKLSKLKTLKSTFQFFLSTAIMSLIIVLLKNFIDNLFLELFVCTFIAIIVYVLCLLILRNEFFLSIFKALLFKLSITKGK